ncbi:MAG TPA: polysaccharide deacetylase family protein [Candidatus Dormibacteraeota bacterium]
MSLGVPSALSVRPGETPSALPRAIGELEPPLSVAESRSTQSYPLTLFVTVDVEDSYFDRPILMTGDGIGREFGVFGILDELDVRRLRGTFFVNVYEADRQPAGVVRSVVQEIAARGHEVGLHAHPSPTMDTYQKPLFRLSQESQAEVLRHGVDLIAHWTGTPPTSFRAGGYALNDDTFAALEDVGIAVDSSCFFPSPNNHNTRLTVNAVAMAGSVIEVPVTTVLRLNGDERLEARKLDIDWLSVDALAATLDALVGQGVDFAMFMMHSFSFIEKLTRMPDDPPSSRARFTSKIDSDRYVEVYGPKPSMRTAFGEFLDHVAGTPDLQVRTLRDALPDLSMASSPADIVPVVR